MNKEIQVFSKYCSDTSIKNRDTPLKNFATELLIIVL